ncbi:MAG: hypothetical protein C4305_00265 [Thermoleophilia bacterium]
MTDWSLGGIAGLGVLHGLNPAMGWLFAVAIGLQERSRKALLVAIVPLSLGHEASIATAVVLVNEARVVTSETAVRVAAASLLFLVAGWKLWRSSSHLRWVGMRLSFLELALWSFLMSSAHGAGLMLFPFVLVDESHSHVPPVASGALEAVLAASVHTLAMALSAMVVSLVVYDVVGLRILRRGWINLDRIWAAALLAGGAATLFLA